MCPTSLDEKTICSFVYPASPSVESVTIHVNDLNGNPLAEVNVPLKKFNRCGIDVAYFTVSLHADKAAVVRDVRYVTPCKSALD